MFRNMLLQLSNFAGRLFRWYAGKVVESWRQEIRRSRKTKDRWIWIGLCVFFALFLLPYLATMAFSEGLLFGLSFIWSTFLAISFAYILRHPVVLILIYIAAALGREVNNLFATATEEAGRGNIIGAIILLSFGVYLMVNLVWPMEKGEI
jgi:hypothetical protein